MSIGKVIVNGKELTPAEHAKWWRRRSQLLRDAGCSLEDGFKARKAPSIDTDTLHLAINRSGLTEEERAYVAKKARSFGMPEDVAYDPTIPGRPVYESKAQVDVQCAEAKAKANAKEGRPEYRLAPRHVRNIRKAMIAENPSLALKDQRELCEQIIENHSPPV
jgi:DNA repair photolyase